MDSSLTTVAEPPPLDEEDDATLRRIAERPRPQAIPRAVGRKHVERAFLNAFELIGGVPRLVMWADQNPTEFFKLYARLLPGGPPIDDKKDIKITISWAGPERLSYQNGEVIDG
jgi:hypothetical protein